jgi:hypothetical protein
MRKTLAILCLSAAAFAQSQTADNAAIVDAAKKSTATSAKAKRVYTDDDLPTTGHVNVLGKDGVKAAKASTDPVRDQSILDRQWQTKIEQQKALIANLQHQLDLAQKVLGYDTHRDPIKPNPAYARRKAQVDLLTQQIADAKDKLSQIQDEAHKAGADKAYD